jgi:hypothetical protein
MKTFSKLLLTLLAPLAMSTQVIAQADCNTASGILALMAAKVVVSTTTTPATVPATTNLPFSFTSELFRVAQNETTNSSCFNSVSFQIYTATTSAALSNLSNLAANDPNFALPAGVRKTTMSKTRSGNVITVTGNVVKTGFNGGSTVFYRLAKRIFNCSSCSGQDPTVFSSTASAVVPNMSPTVNAGTSKTITLPTTSTSVTGTATDSDGSIASVQWTSASTNPTVATFSQANNLTTTIGNLTAVGAYTITLIATDNLGANRTSSMVITVASPSPVVNAGADRTVNLPTSTVNLSGTATTPAGTIVNSSIRWTRVSGPNTPTFSSTSSLTPTVSGLIQGTYTFRLEAQNSFGKTSSDNVVVTVVPLVLPDLSVSVTNIFDGTVPNNTISNLCPTSPNTTKNTTIPDLSIQIRDLNNVGTTTPFTVRIGNEFGSRDTVINGLQPNQVITFTANSTRVATSGGPVETRVCATLSNTSQCLRCGNGINGIVYWDDHGFSVKVDVLNAISEANNNKTNNNFLFP